MLFFCTDTKSFKKIKGVSRIFAYTFIEVILCVKVGVWFMNIRERSEELERKILSRYACLSSESKGREINEEKCTVRTEFQRDRDRIIHCKAFRRLKHKTQVFLSPEGDHYRTRLTHTLEVSQIARTVARAMRLNEDLTEAVSLAHDLGHTPFGHAGERALDSLVPGGFRHYEQSLRVVDKLEKEGVGLNLTYETRNGILCHTTGKEADTVEGRIVRIADRIAYINHDIDDAVRAGIISMESLPRKASEILGKTTAQRINTLVLSLIEFSDGENLGMSEDVQEVFGSLYEFMSNNVYCNEYAKREEKKVPEFISLLYGYFVKHPQLMPEENRRTAEEESVERAVCDYLAGMTDRYAIEQFRRIFVPNSWIVR